MLLSEWDDLSQESTKPSLILYFHIHDVIVEINKLYHYSFLFCARGYYLTLRTSQPSQSMVIKHHADIQSV